MKNKKKILTSNVLWISLFTLLAVVSISVILIKFSENNTGKTAKIYSDNKLIRTVILNKDDEFTVENGDNYNIVRIKNGKISVVEANCKNQICVKQGETDRSLLPIVCVPNGLVIKVDDGDKKMDIDAEL